MNANPIRRLVTMMQKMEKKVIAEGEAQEKAFNKYMCYCKSSTAALSASIAAGEEKVPQIESQIEELTASEAQLTSDLAAHQQDRADAKGSIGDATGKREEEAAQFAKESGDYNTNIKALGGAIPAIEQGLGGSFVQTSSGRRVQKLLQNADLQTADASVVTAFLQGGASMRGSSGEIVGILKQMKEDMEADLKELTAAEDSAIATFNELVAAKEKEIAAATAAIEDKSARKGETSVSLANAKHDLSDTSANLADDQKFLADMKGACGEQEKAWEQVSAMRTRGRGAERCDHHAQQRRRSGAFQEDAFVIFRQLPPDGSVEQGCPEARACGSPLAEVQLHRARTSRQEGRLREGPQDD